jgi:Tat protein secretion system quality control protein TatD with DNase activity
MKIFDCHLHVEKGLKDYDLELSGANVIFNSIASYDQHQHLYPDYNKTLIFDLEKEPGYFDQLFTEKKIDALKIHSRLQKISKDGYGDLISKLKNLKNNIPVIYDAFYYGTDLDNQPSLKGLIQMTESHPQTKFIVAHSGGYEVLRYFFHLKANSNVGFDLSFSLQYLSDSSCRPDFVKLLKYIPSERIFFGTDYPFCSPAMQLKIFNQLTQDAGLNSSEIENICSANWLRFIQR